MNDLKNISIAWASAFASVCTAIEARTVITIISAVILPIVFFALGKTIDVCLQIYFRREQMRRSLNETSNGSAALDVRNK